MLRETAESQSALEVYQLAQEKKRDKARGYVILPPKVSRLPWKNVLDDWMRDESARSESQARAAVRDGDPSIEVLVMVQHRDGTVHFLPWQEQGEAVPTDRPPSLEESRKIARQRLRLPGHFSRRWNIDTVIQELEQQNGCLLKEWQFAPMLEGELVLLLEEDLSAGLAGERLFYDREEGLTYRKEEAHAGNGV